MMQERDLGAWSWDYEVAAFEADLEEAREAVKDIERSLAEARLMQRLDAERKASKS